MDHIVKQVQPFNVWGSKTAGKYDIQTLFNEVEDNEQHDGHIGLYRCLLSTANSAHWNGQIFTVIVNGLYDDTWQHRLFDVTSLDAGSRGCNGPAVTNFNAGTGSVGSNGGGGGTFDYAPGDCKQSISLDCNSNFYIDDDGQPEAFDEETGLCDPPETLLADLKAFSFTELFATLPTTIERSLEPKSFFGPVKSGGTYSLARIFDNARAVLDVDAHTYRCLLVTDNEAHFTGRMFTLILNHYAQGTHKIYDVTALDAGKKGCSGGLTDWTLSPDTADTVGTFTFDSGNCTQAIRMDCRGMFH
jgi:hypothetical protein